MMVIAQDFRQLKSWGMNVVRLGMMWPGVEPSRGVYNQSYLNVMNQLVTKMGQQYGIYTLVDFHQG
jgi:endoglycosylceramidase